MRPHIKIKVTDGSQLDPRPRFDTIKRLLEEKGLPDVLATLADFVSLVRRITDRWQQEDWNTSEQDDSLTLNNARIVGQVWFRGQATCDASLQPGLYRKGLRANLTKAKGSPQPGPDARQKLVSELFDLEHDQRIDFTSYGHLLNEVNQAKTPIDWYFLMQHHGLPTRLLDWTTNALAALFFALDAYRRRLEDKRIACPEDDVAVPLDSKVAVWMIDAYWLADHLSEDSGSSLLLWGGPLLPWSEDASRYIPPLERLIDRMADSKALLPEFAMPIEPPAMHPRVAAQEGRFIIFGKTQDLMDERIRLRKLDSGVPEELRVNRILFNVNDPDAILRDLSQLGVSRRTLFPDLAGLADFIKWKHFHQVRGYQG